MANDFATVADHLADAYDLAGYEIEQLKEGAPLMSRLPIVFPSNGDEHKWSKTTRRHVTGFRSANAGRGASHVIDAVVSEDLKILDWHTDVDKAIADAWRKGAANYVARENLSAMADALFRMEKQVLSGTVDADASGFNGLPDLGDLDALADDMVIDAGGTTVDTASSCYLLRVNLQEVAGVMTEEIVPQDTIVQAIADSSQQNYTAYYTPGEAWAGFQYGTKYSAARIVNLTEDSGKGLTDALIFEAIKAFPAGMGPNLIVCSQRSLEQLRSSRTATNITGAPAPTPESVANVPIISSDGLIDTEALIA